MTFRYLLQHGSKPQMSSLGGTDEKVRASQQSVGFVLWGTGNSMVICLIAVEISVDQSGEPPPNQ